MSTLLQLEKYELRTFSVKWHEMRDPKSGVELIPSFDFDMGIYQNEPRRFWLELRYASSSAEECKEAFEIDVAIVGLFVCPEDWDEAERIKRGATNGCNILYGVLRGLITTITAQFPLGTYFLPTVNMDDVVMRVAKSKATESGGEVVGPPQQK